MTIVIAKKFDDSITILSDTKVTYDEKRVPLDRKSMRSSPMDGVLKTIILYSDVCISFAGDTKIACNIIKEFKNQLDTNVDLKQNWSAQKCAELLHQQTLKHAADVEFILCVTNEGEADPKQFIYKISKETSKDQIADAPSAWIGDVGAFGEFQKIFHPKREQEEEKSAFSSAFHSLVQQDKIPGIGDFVITTTYDKEYGFRYRTRFWSKLTIEVPKDVKPNEEITMGTGTAAKGDYHEVYFESMYFCDPAVAIFFPIGNFGIFFYAPEALNNEGRGVIIKNVDESGFLEEIGIRYKIPLYGFEVREDGLSPIFSSIHEIENHAMTRVTATGVFR